MDIPNDPIRGRSNTGIARDDYAAVFQTKIRLSAIMSRKIWDGNGRKELEQVFMKRASVKTDF